MDVGGKAQTWNTAGMCVIQRSTVVVLQQIGDRFEKDEARTNE